THARIARVTARASATGIRAIAEQSVVARSRVGRVDARPGPVAVVVRADVAVARAPRCARVEAVVRRLVARVVAFRSARARVPGMGAAGPTATRVRPVAE